MALGWSGTALPVAPRTIDSVFPPWLIEKHSDFFSPPRVFSTPRCHLFDDASYLMMRRGRTS
jgi:hypothetical protein